MISNVHHKVVDKLKDIEDIEYLESSVSELNAQFRRATALGKWWVDKKTENPAAIPVPDVKKRGWQQNDNPAPLPDHPANTRSDNTGQLSRINLH